MGAVDKRTSDAERKESDASVLLETNGLKIHFYTEDGVVKAVDGVSIRIDRGKVLGVVGESGCGKSVTAFSILQLIQHPGRIVDGTILYYGQNGVALDIAKLKPDKAQMVNLRGNEISMIFQEPMTAMTPVYTIGKQIMEAIMRHSDVSKAEARERAVEMLIKVGMPAPHQRVDQYPFQLSGGMAQRALIAMALSTNPKLLIADEPTTALDVTVQAQILRLMMGVRESTDMAIMLITHDLGVIAKNADDVVVMYLGNIVERGTVRQVYHNPQHPYTRGLLNSVPRIDRRTRLVAIKGVVPTPYNLPSGCRFATRCPRVFSKCEEEPPEFIVEGGHSAKCWLAEGIENER